LPPRSRKRGRREPKQRPAVGAVPAAPKPPSRTEERNAAVRATLRPLTPGERPWPIKIAALIALLVGGGDLIEVIFGGRIKFGSTHPSVGGIVLFSILMLVCAVGVWQLRYWAVLGFQAILGIVILIFSLLLVRASNLLGFVVAAAIIGLGGWLFFKLVRVLSRLQLPKYPGNG
jgi:amino acid permease